MFFLKTFMLIEVNLLNSKEMLLNLLTYTEKLI